jgi:hypothetical protein
MEVTSICLDLVEKLKELSGNWRLSSPNLDTK